jgi:membrane protease YdiL (CAAX protease family)
MLTLLLVLGFPLILLAGYGSLYLLLRRDREVLLGPAGFGLYLGLLTIPLAAVLASESFRVEYFFESGPWTPAWLAVGVLVGLLLAGFQALTLPAQTGEARVWTGPPGWGGFIVLMGSVAYIVVAEEVIWRGYLTMTLAGGPLTSRFPDGLSPPVGLVLASAVFALHHYFFGVRHMVFAFAAGIVWGSLLFLEERLYSAITSHFVYNVFAWAWMRHQIKMPTETP